MRLAPLALILAMSTSAAFAQDTMTMDSGVTMLADSAQQAFVEYGIEADAMTLTLAQLAEIAGIITSKTSSEDAKSRIEAAIAHE